jgi:flavin reductase (DIM6/NTAB) family NADH-FMN oxidoreductase RutF
MRESGAGRAIRKPPQAARLRRPPADPDGQVDAMLRSCLGRFATGVTVVSFHTPDGPRGVTVNAFTSVSLEPPIVLVSIAKAGRAHDALRERSFCVNVLGAEQEALARCFAGGDSDVDPRWVEGRRAPRLQGVLAHIECTPWRVYDGGDHSLFLGEIVDFGHRDGDALAYMGSRFTTIAESETGVEYLI